MASTGTLILIHTVNKNAHNEVIDWVCYTPDNHPILPVKDNKMVRRYFNSPHQKRILIVLVTILLTPLIE